MLDDLYYLRERARQAAARGDLTDAANALFTAAQQTHVAENDYLAILRPLEDVLLRLGDVRSALTVLWYSIFSDRDSYKRAQKILQKVPAVDRARTLAAVGDMANAAREMEDAGLIAGGAIYKEKSEDWNGARALWSRLSQVMPNHSGHGDTAYIAGLVQFNLARCARKCHDERQAREALVASVRWLEEAADYFESSGLRERAFDCFQVLSQIGREGGMFENVLEGFVNCIRILREDHLKYFALQYYEDALDAAREKSELSAAATLAREASEYARSIGMTATSLHYTLMQGELWRQVAEQHLRSQAPAEIAENALLASVLAFGEVSQFARVGKLYLQLSAMDLEPSRKKHYARAAKRYEGERDEPVESSPLAGHLKQDNAFPDVWHVDVIEWEEQGSASEACGDVLLDRRWPDLVRRKAMLARITSFSVEGPADETSEAIVTARVRLCEQLAKLELYTVLSPLENLFRVNDRSVKIAVLTAIQNLFFKRSFVTLRQGLRDGDPAVAEQAAKALEKLAFPHAFDPLARIVRESTSERARSSALRALSRIDTLEAAEFLLGVLEHGVPSDRKAAVVALKDSRGMRFVELARGALPSSAAETQTVLRDLLRARGVAA